MIENLLTNMVRALKQADSPQAIVNGMNAKNSGYEPTESCFIDCFLTSLRNLDCNFSSL